jgi:hypothetical protein
MWRYNRRRRPDLGASPLGATYGRAPHNDSYVVNHIRLGNTARPGLCGGLPVRAVPTAEASQPQMRDNTRLVQTYRRGGHGTDSRPYSR